MSKRTTYPIGDGAHLCRGQFEAARPPKQSPARETLPTTPPPVPPHLERLRAGANKWRDTVIRQAIEDDPASFRYQRDKAHAAIRELLALLDAVKARADRYELAIGMARHCWDVHGDASMLQALDDSEAANVYTCDRCEAES